MLKSRLYYSTIYSMTPLLFTQEEAERKRQEALERKKENDRLYTEERESMKAAKPEPKAKLTRADIAAHQEKMAAQGNYWKKKTGIVLVRLLADFRTFSTDFWPPGISIQIC